MGALTGYLQGEFGRLCPAGWKVRPEGKLLPDGLADLLGYSAYADVVMEKLDDSRVRLRRSVSWRQKDGTLAQDPYRTKVGMSEAVLGLWIALGALGGTAVPIGIVLLVVSK